MRDLRHIEHIGLSDCLDAAGGDKFTETDIRVTPQQAGELYLELQHTLGFDSPHDLRMTDKSVQWGAIRLYST